MPNSIRLSDTASSVQSESYPRRVSGRRLSRRRVSVEAFLGLALLALPIHAVAQSVPNGGFEIPAVSNFQAQPSGGSWTFTAGAGLARNGSAYTFANHSAPEGVQVGFLAGTGSVQQTFSGFTSGHSYQITFFGSSFAEGPGSTIQLEMREGAHRYFLGSYKIDNDPSYRAYTTAPFTMTGAAGTLTITSKSTNGGVALIDQVAVQPIQPSGSLTAATGSPFAAGSSPISMATADFNLDGRTDIATASADGVTVLLGNGAGGFAAPGGVSAAGNFPVTVAAGDFNGDGYPDLVVANHLSNNVTVLLGLGTGSFLPGTSFSAGTGPIGVAVGDLNGDGKSDIVATNGDGNNITILIGNGAGGFTQLAGSPFATGTNPGAIALVDFNADGRLDIAVANNFSNDVTVLLGTVSGSFTPAAGSPIAGLSSPNVIVVGDLNGDGKPDIAANTTNGVRVLLGNGTGGFSAATSFSTGAGTISLALGDYDGDGDLDIGAANFNAGTAQVLLGNGVGAFTSAPGNPFSVGNGFRQLVAADFNGDGRLDIAGLNGTKVAILLGGLTASSAVLTTTAPFTITYGTPVPLTLSLTPVAALVVPTGTVTFIDGSTPLGTASEASSPYTFDPGTLAAGAHTLKAAYSGDSRSSAANSNSFVVTVTQQSQTIAISGVPPSAAYNTMFTVSATGGGSGNAVVFTSSGGCTNNGPTYKMTSGTASCTVIANQPGNTNYSAAPQVTTPVSATLAPQTITFGAKSGLAFVGSTMLVTATGASGLPVTLTTLTSSVCRISGSIVTILTAGTCTIHASVAGNSNYTPATANQGFTTRVALPAGSLIPASGSPFTAANSPNSMVVGDFNGDGISDLATLNSGDTVTVQLGNGSGGFAPAGNPAAVGVNAVSLMTGDFDGDGKLDIATTNSRGHSITVLLGNGNGGFAQAAGSPFSVVTSAQAGTVGDFNGDGRPDIAVVNTSTDTVVLLWNSSSGFSATAVSSFSVGADPISITAGDFNGDGDLDIATANAGNNSVTLLLGNGSGGFVSDTGSPFAVGSHPFSVTAGNFSADGKLDIVTANADDDNITVLTSAKGGFTTATFPVGSAPVSVTAGDFNGDGKLDIATGSSTGNSVTVLLGNGLGGFTPAAGNPFIAARRPVVGDFNGDGRLDLAAANSESDSVTVLLGSLAVTSTSVSTTPSSGIAFGDAITLNAAITPSVDPFNAVPAGTVTFLDGVTVLGTASVSPYQIVSGPLSGGNHSFTAVYSGDVRNASSTSSPVTLTIPVAQTVTFGALSGQPYVVGQTVTAGAQTSSGLPVTLSSTTPGVCRITGSIITILSAGGCTIQASNAGNNNYTPVTATQSFTTVAAVPSNTLLPASGSPLPAGNSPRSVAIGDFNGDGKLDLAAVNINGNNITVMLGNGTGGFAPAPGSPVATGNAPGGIAVGDFNGDGKLDLATANSFGNNVTVLLGNGSGGFAPAPSSPFAAGGSPYGLMVGDFNGDGKLDLATANFDTNNVTVLLGSGSGGFAPAMGSPFAAGGGPISLTLGDFNGDGKLDLATANSFGNNVTVLLADGSGGFAPAPESPFGAGTSPYGVTAGDFNGDGKLDIATANFWSTNVTVLLGNGSGGFIPAAGSPFTTGDGPFSVTSGDFNGDGKVDLVTANYSGNNIAVLVGNGSGGFAPATGSLFAVGSSPASVAVGDLNGDGKLDIVTANNGSKNMTVLLGGSSAVTTTSLATTATANITYGTPVPLTATVSRASSLGGALAGSVTFLDGVATLGTDTSSPYSFTSTTLGVGPHTLTAAYSGDPQNSPSVSVSRTITVTKAPQTITFTTSPPASAASLSSFTVAATSSGGLSVAFTSSGSCTNAGPVYTMNSATGSCSVIVDQAGDANYVAAPQVIRIVAATQGAQTAQTITFTTSAPASAIYQSGFTVAAAGGASGNPVTFTSSGACTNAGVSYTMISGTGACSVIANQAGNVGYTAAQQVTQIVTAVRKTQAIAFTTNAPASAIYQSGFTVAATGGASGNPVTFSSSGSCTNAGVSYTMTSGTGICLVTADQAGNSNYLAAVQVIQNVNALKITPLVTWAAPAAVTFGSALSSSQLNATANVPGTFSYTPAAGTVLPAGSNQLLAVAFTPADAANYTAATGSTIITVNAAPPASPPSLVVTRTLSRFGDTILVQITVANTGGSAANNVVLTSAKVGTATATPLPQTIGTIAAGASAQMTVTVPGSTGAPGAASTLTVSGTYTGGTFSSSARIVLP